MSVISKTSNTVVTNIVNKKALREVQKKTLETLSDSLQKSFGPMGSNSCIKKENAFNQYSKDGHTILSNIYFSGIIEQSIKDDVESITRHIVKTVGDGTTSAVILSSLIFNHIIELEEKYSPVEIQRSLERVCDMINKEIKNHSEECDLEDIYHICMVATNGNKTVSSIIYDIYKEMGMEVFIDVSVATGTDSMIKYYDGMTINTGFSDSMYVNDKKKNTCTISKPQVYFFEHPIDTREMSVYFDAIVSKNIIQPFVEITQNKNMKAKMIPTVIVAPRISQDLCGTMDSIVAAQTQLPPANKLPLLIITETHQINEILDLCKLCGARSIRKYIDAKIYEEDKKNGRAPTPENIFNWAGECEQVVSDTSKTKFINPKEMYDKDGNKSTTYNNLLDFLTTELKGAIDGGKDTSVIGQLRRRINSLKSNMVEYFVGGITVADRDSLRDLIEDAVLSCRSAAENGIGYAANCQALFTLYNLRESVPFQTDSINTEIFRVIYNSYIELIKILYNNSGINIFIKDLIENQKPIDINTGEYDGRIITSIESDITILNTVCKIIGIMSTCNQFILPTPMHNIYDNM